jgi:phage terminase Nu1 subunit (DNA packaging protein)
VTSAKQSKLVEAAGPSGVLRTVRAGMLTVPIRAAQQLPHLSARDVSVIDSEVRALPTEIGSTD